TSRSMPCLSRRPPHCRCQVVIVLELRSLGAGRSTVSSYGQRYQIGKPMANAVSPSNSSRRLNCTRQRRKKVLEERSGIEEKLVIFEMNGNPREVSRRATVLVVKS